MRGWTYSRGKWTAPPRYGKRTEREILADDRLKKWNIQKRWAKFPQLGPIPQKWMDVGPAPQGLVPYLNEVFISVYLGPVREMMNAPTPLLRYLRNA